MEDGYATRTEAITADATIWRTAAADLEAPRTTVGSLTLTIEDFGFIVDGQGFGGAYEQLRQRIETLLDGGQRSYDNFSTTLDSVAMAYDTQELTNLDELSGAAADLEGP
ncbi:hypothetical protein [Actinophytocola sediminis]